MVMTDEQRTLIVGVAAEAKVPAALAMAICFKESSFRTAAFNPEPKWIYLWDLVKNRPFRALTPAEIASERPPDDFYALPNVPVDAEWWGQQMSWGLMQVMGGVAREQGFRGDFLNELSVYPRIGLTCGCRYLAGRYAKYGNWPDAIAAYNAGSARRSPDGRYDNQSYVDDVTEAWTRYG